MSLQQDCREEDLPEGIADLVDVIGFAATLRLIEHCPGIRIRPPKEDRLHAEHRLVRAIGLDAARALSRLADGLKIEVPRAAVAIRRARNRAMKRDEETMSQPQLALKYGLTQRQVRTILKIRRPPQAQRDGVIRMVRAR